MPDKEATQRERFEQAARELGVDLDEEKLREALRRISEAPQVEQPDAKRKPSGS